jgi:integrase
MKSVRPYPYLYRDKDRQGAARWRLRAPGRKTVTIDGVYGSPEFAANYRTALEGVAVGTVAKAIGKHGTFDALGRSYLRSSAFAGLAAETQRSRRRLVESFIGKYGKLSVAGLRRDHVKLIMEAYADRPGVARNVLSMLRVLLALAIEDGIRNDDPTANIKRPKLSAEGWHAWTEEQICAFEAKHPVGSEARLAFALALYTGQRAADLIKMGRQHVRDGTISVAQQKTGTRLWVPIHSELRAILDSAPAEHLTFIISEKGKPYAKATSLSHAMNRWAKDAGITGCPLHGLRKACCRRLAEAGCTVPEIMAISGHKSLSEVERYTKTADQKLMAERAITRTESYPRNVQRLPTEKKA